MPSDLFPDRIETDRLVLAAASPETVDVHELYRVCSGDDIEAVTEYVAWDPHPHPKETLAFLERAAEQHASGEAAQYVVRPADDESTIAGMTGLTVRWDRNLAEPGIWLRPQFWGRGYSGERADALLALAFDHLDLGCIAVEVRPENENSRRAVERYVERHGGRHEGVLRHADVWASGPVDLHRFSVTRAEYEAADATTSVSLG